MKLKEKPKRSYGREVLDAIQAALGRADIGMKTVTIGIDSFRVITDMEGNELELTTEEEARIRALEKVREKLE